MHSWAFLLSLLAASLARGQVRNVTIDDGTGDENSRAIPVYGGAPPWRARSPGDSCPQCFLQPAGDMMVGGTWHDATTDRTAEPAEILFTFTGANLFVFCTLAGLHKDTSTQTHLTLIVDGASVDTFDWVPDVSSPAFQYQYPVLAAKGLENKDHAVKILSHRYAVNGEAVGSLILFDYALYNTDTSVTSNDAAPSTTGQSLPTMPPNHKSGSSKLVLSLGIVFGVVGVLLLIGSLVVFLRTRRRRSQTQLHEVHSNRGLAPSPLPLPPSSSPTEVRSVYDSEPATTLPLNLGSPVVTSLSDRKLHMRAGLMSDKSDRGDMPPPSYS